VQHDELHLAQNRAETTLIDAVKYVDDSLIEMEKQLQISIATLDSKCTETNIALSQPPFTDGNADPSEVVLLLEQTEHHVEHLRQSGESYSKMNQMFKERRTEQANQFKRVKKKDPSEADADAAAEQQEKRSPRSGPVAQTHAEFVKRKELWDMFHTWKMKWNEYSQADLRIFMNPEHEEAGPFGSTYNNETFAKDIEEYYQQGVRLARSWKGDSVAEKMISELKIARNRCDYIGQLGHPSLLERHWREIYTLFGTSYDPQLTNVTLNSLERYDIFDETMMESIDNVCATAGKEYSLLKAMEKMESEWVEMFFDPMVYKETGTSILRGLDDVEQLLDDHIVRTQAMRGSRFIGPLKPRVEKWEIKLNLLSEIMEEWLSMQGTWLYLEPIFSSEDICKQMPAEAKRFQQVDTVWRDNMTATSAEPACLAATERDGLLGRLRRGNKLLDEIQKGLSDYLNEKREKFLEKILIILKKLKNRCVL